MIAICLDMDGTLNRFYDVPGWREKLNNEDVSPYLDAKPNCNMRELRQTLMLLQKAGYEIQIITAMSRNATPQYKKAIRAAKLEWLEKWGLAYDRFHCVDYKTNKSTVLYKSMKPGDSAILVDDEPRHLDKWKWGGTINASECDIVEALMALVGEV